MAAGTRNVYLEEFTLYETKTKFYLVGSDKSRAHSRVLMIDRMDASELKIQEDPTTYSKEIFHKLQSQVYDENTGGLKFLTKCYGIVGFVKFLGPYYMLLITERRNIGTICGHAVYAVSKSTMVTVPNSELLSDIAYSKDEKRYKSLIGSVDLTKDFFFSYSYNIMRSLQKNLSDSNTEQILHETMFVWNEYLTRSIRNHLKNTMWTVALVHGFFEQAKLSISGKDFILTLIARRSRHYAGPRYLKRGVNGKGRVANDVETEQIVYEYGPDEIPSEISAVVQNRGSIPIFWSQETTRRRFRPDIIVHKKDNYLKATKLHFDNLVGRYGNPIVILNLIRSREKKPRESPLHAEFKNAIDCINSGLTEENQLRFVHWDIHKHSRRIPLMVLAMLGKVAADALNLTGFFYYQIPPDLRKKEALTCPILKEDNSGKWLLISQKENTTNAIASEIDSLSDEVRDSEVAQIESSSDGIEHNISCSIKLPKLQGGVVRTNCIDCLDRTNSSQYAYGLVALGYQLQSLEFIDAPVINLGGPLASDLLALYERMGDALAFQYAGSPAHNQIFCHGRGQSKLIMQCQEFFRAFQRFYNNAYMDKEKQDAINIFLGHFQPSLGKPALWELDSDQSYSLGRSDSTSGEEIIRSSMKRSLSDSNIKWESDTFAYCVETKGPTIEQDVNTDRSHFTPEIPTYTPHGSQEKPFSDTGGSEHRSEASDYSNFLEPDWLSSLANLHEEDLDRTSICSSLSSLSFTSALTDETASPLSETDSVIQGWEGPFSRRFANWVINGDTFFFGS